MWPKFDKVSEPEGKTSPHALPALFSSCAAVDA